jgi:hypothetical protein
VFSTEPLVPDPRRRRASAGSSASWPKKALAPGAGFEPATNRLTVDCSTAELSGISGRRIPTPLRLRNPFRKRSTGIASPIIIPRGWRLQRAPACGYRRPSGPRCGVLPWKASWRSGYAEDCKSLHPGSIPGEASNLPKIIMLGQALRAGWSRHALAPRRLAFCSALEQKARMGGDDAGQGRAPRARPMPGPRVPRTEISVHGEFRRTAPHDGRLPDADL